MVDENDSLDETRDKEQIDKKYLAGSKSGGGSLEDAFGDFFSDVEKDVKKTDEVVESIVVDSEKEYESIPRKKSEPVRLPEREESETHVSTLIPVHSASFLARKREEEKQSVQSEHEKKIAAYEKNLENAHKIINDKQGAVDHYKKEIESIDAYVGSPAEEFNTAKRKQKIRKNIEKLIPEIQNKRDEIVILKERIDDEKKAIKKAVLRSGEEKTTDSSVNPDIAKLTEKMKVFFGDDGFKSEDQAVSAGPEPTKTTLTIVEEEHPTLPVPQTEKNPLPDSNFENEKRLLLRNIESHEYARGQTLVAIKKERDPHRRVLFEEDVVLIDKDIERYKNELAVIEAELRKIENKDIVETKVDDSKQKVNDSQTVEIKIQDPLILRKIESHEYARDQITRALKIEKNPKTIKLLQEKIRLIDVDLVKFRKALEEVSESDIENVVEEETELIKETPEVSEVVSEPQTHEVLSDVDMSEEPSLVTNTQSEVGPVSMHALKYIKKMSPEGKAFVAENMKQKFWNNTVDKIRFALSGTIFNWHEKKASQLNSERNRIGAKIKELEDKVRTIAWNIEGAQNRNIDPIRKRESRAERNKYDMELEIQKLSNEKHRIEGSLFQREMAKKSYIRRLNTLSENISHRVGWLISPFKMRIERVGSPIGEIEVENVKHEKEIKAYESAIGELKKKLSEKKSGKDSEALKKEIADFEKALANAKKSINNSGARAVNMDGKIKALKDRIGYWEKIVEEFKKKVPEDKDYLNINSAA